MTLRYRSILSVLEKLITCPQGDIGKLNWESVEIEMSSRDNIGQNSSDNNSVNELIGYVIHVKSDKLNLRNAASTKSEVITTLSKGQSMDYIEELNDEWIKVRVKYWNSDTNTYNIVDGFVFSEYTNYSHNQRMVEEMLRLQQRD
jgi:uncharacterized protein YgiM (DUF1202 family)